MKNKLISKLIDVDMEIKEANKQSEIIANEIKLVEKVSFLNFNIFNI